MRALVVDATQVDLGLQLLEVQRGVEHRGIGDRPVITVPAARAAQDETAAGHSARPEPGQTRDAQEAAAVDSALGAAVDRLTDERLVEALARSSFLIRPMSHRHHAPGSGRAPHPPDESQLGSD